MSEYFIFLSCSDGIKIRREEIEKYIKDTIFSDDDSKPQKILNCIDNDDCIRLEDFLNIILETEGTINVLKPSSVDISKENFGRLITHPSGEKSKYRYNGMYIVNVNGIDPDKISYWEMGHAHAKDLRIFGYKFEGMEDQPNEDLFYCMGGEIVTSLAGLMAKISNSLNPWNLKFPNSRHWHTQWEQIRRACKTQ